MRRRANKQSVGIVLFPFLAVLICTMGALVVLLMLLVQQAKVDAESSLVAQAAANAESRRSQEEQQIAFEDARWRQEILEKQRSQMQQQLADRRLELSHIEDHIRRLEDAARKLTARLKELDGGNPSAAADLAPLQKELSSLQQAIAAKQKELDEKRKRLVASEQAYALVPYEGRNGTRRMPLYIECVAEGVILQPEGVLLVAADFDGPGGSGNPLDAALRAKREYLAKATGGKGAEPYPLLVVRPSGVIAYLEARSAIKYWEDEFGYELVAEDLNLDFGECDLQLDQVLRQTVRDARRRQQTLAAAMPRKYRPVAAPTTFAADDHPDVQAMRQAAAASGRGASSVGGSGGMGVGQSKRYADGRPSRQAMAEQAAAEAAADGTPPTDAGAPKMQHGGDPRQEGVAGGVAGAKSGKSLPAAAAAQRRGGANWGLPGAAGRTFGVTRPIHAICLADRIVLLPDRRDAARPQEITLSRQMTVAELDELVTAIHKQMATWGLAAENGYWKPVLLVEVGGDAAPRLAELEAALEGSGIEVQRKQR